MSQPPLSCTSPTASPAPPAPATLTCVCFLFLFGLGRALTTAAALGLGGGIGSPGRAAVPAVESQFGHGLVVPEPLLPLSTACLQLSDLDLIEPDSPTVGCINKRHQKLYVCTSRPRAGSSVRVRRLALWLHVGAAPGGLSGPSV